MAIACDIAGAEYAENRRGLNDLEDVSSLESVAWKPQFLRWDEARRSALSSS